MEEEIQATPKTEKEQILEDDTPKWLFPLFKRALNQREPGLGDRVIGSF